MLTKSDLSEIKKIIDVSIGPVQQRTESIEKGTETIEKDIKTIKRSIKKINKTTNAIISHFDREDVQLHKRVRKIEDYLGIPS